MAKKSTKRQAVHMLASIEQVFQGTKGRTMDGTAKVCVRPSRTPKARFSAVSSKE